MTNDVVYYPSEEMIFRVRTLRDRLVLSAEVLILWQRIKRTETIFVMMNEFLNWLMLFDMLSMNKMEVIRCFNYFICISKLQSRNDAN
jgi:hypothetical protein